MRGVEQPDKGGLAAAIDRITGGISRLVSEHLALARVELRDDVRALATSLVGIAIFLPLILVGYGFLCGAIAFALSPHLGWAGALLLVGGVNVVGGGFGAYRAANKLQAHHVLESTRVEVMRTTSTLTTAAKVNGTHSAERRFGA